MICAGRVVERCLDQGLLVFSLYLSYTYFSPLEDANRFAMNSSSQALQQNRPSYRANLVVNRSPQLLQ